MIGRVSLAAKLPCRTGISPDGVPEISVVCVRASSNAISAPEFPAPTTSTRPDLRDHARPATQPCGRDGVRLECLLNEPRCLVLLERQLRRDPGAAREFRSAQAGPKLAATPRPLIRVKTKDLEAAGVERVARVVG